MPDRAAPFTPDEEQRIQELLRKAKRLVPDGQSTMRIDVAFHFDEKLSDADVKLFDRYMHRTYIAGRASRR
jgi:hypothetical protein